jgi:anti-sigma regulatory factor (Ser/Thr protein kinase)
VSEEGVNPGLSPRRLELEMPAVHMAVRMARSTLRRFARLDGLPDREVDSLLLVASELLANAVDHGGGQAAADVHELNGSIRMRVWLELDQGAWRLGVEDQGGGDPEELRLLLRPVEPPDLEDERGRGFFLLGQLVEQMDVEPSRDGRGLLFTATRTYGDGD